MSRATAARPDSAARPGKRRRKPARGPASSATRQRVIDATLDLIRSDGIGSLTTVAIAKQADIHQPNFYAYFANIDDCLAAAAEQIGERFHAFDADAFAELKQAVETGGQYLEVSCRYHERLLETLLRERRVTELFLRHRHDHSPFGKVLRDFERRAVDRLTENLWDLGIRVGLRGKHLSEVRLLAELLSGTTGLAVLSLLEGRADDPARVAQMLARNADASIRATFRRLLAEA